MAAMTAISVLALTLTQAGSAVPDAEMEKVQAERWLKLYSEIASQYQITKLDEPEKKLTLETAPVLKYTNPVRRAQQNGALYVWTDAGRPAVIGSIWSKALRDPSRRRIAHEFHSLSNHSLVAEHAVGVRWRPKANRVVSAEFASANAPSDVQAVRRRQMRTLARECSAWLMTTPGTEGEELRLLSQPVWEYESRKQGVLDGALFAYTLATDPELILQLEAVAREGEGRVWEFTAVRLTSLPLELRRTDKVIWDVQAATPGAEEESYFLNSQVEVRNAILE